MKHPLPESALDNHVAILGKTGSGKTYTAKGVVEQLLRQNKRVCIIDPTSAYWGLRAGADGKSDGFPVVVFGGPKADVPLDKSHGELLAEIVGTSHTPAIIDTRLLSVSDRTRFFADFAEALLRKNKGSLHLIIDEAHLFAPQGRVSDPQSGKMLHAANNLVSLGRGIGLKIMLITQRPAKLHKDSLTQVETLIAMRLVAPQDRAAVNEWIGEWADPKQGKAMLAELPSLPSGTGWIWSPLADVLKRAQFPRISTYDSSKAPQGEGKEPVMAAIDIETLQTRLKSVSNQVEENDPKTLKKQIVELERQLKATGPTVDEMETVRSEAYSTGYRAAMAAVERFVQQPANANTHAPEPLLRKLEVVKIPKAKTADLAKKAADSSLGGGEKKILAVLAQYLSGCTREQLTVLTGYKRSSRDAYIQRLKSKGWATGAADGLMATPAGIEALGDDYEPLPTGDALRQYWLDTLPEGEKRILSILINNYPSAVDRDFISESTGYKRSSRDAYLQRLSVRQLVKRVDGGARASEHLFEGGR
ncbi:hypothetical protein GCM10027347_59570 [Larkinella harenae]